MSPILVLTILIIIIVLALMASAFANFKQQQRLVVSKTSQRHRQKADLCSELAILINQLSDDRAITAELIGVAIKKYRSVLELEPNARHIQTALNEAEQLARNLPGAHSPVAFSNEQEIVYARSQLTNAERIFRRMVEAGEIPANNFDAYHKELLWLYLKIEVDFLVRQAELAAERKDRLQNLTYYQKALNTLKNSSLSDDRRVRRIKEIADSLAGRKQQINTDISAT